MQPQIVCDNLTLGYDGKPILSGLSFSVSAGDYLCILGENGSGKSTLMRTLLSLQAPMAGSVVFSGVKPGEIGYLPQQTAVQRDFPASAREVVLSGCQARLGLRPFYSRADKALAAAQMERLGISALAGRCYRELSGGQQQRVLLARALCATRSLLLLDEPVAGLDPEVTAELYRLIADLNHTDGVTVIMISHDVAAAVRYADHVLHIGDPLFFGTREEYRKTVSGRLLTEREGDEEA